MAIKKLIAKDEITEVEVGVQHRSEEPSNPSDDQVWFQNDTQELKIQDGSPQTLSDTYVYGQKQFKEVNQHNILLEENTYKYNNTVSGAGNFAYSVAFESDGKMLIAGEFTTFGGNTRNYLVKLNPNGTEDVTFYTTLVTGGAINGAIYNALVQPDGKIIIGGNFTSFKGITLNRLARMNSNGTADTTFNTNLGTGFNARTHFRSVVIQENGQILVGGDFTTFKGVTRNRLVRLNSDGTEDTTFYTNMGTAFGGIVRAIEVLPDGKILVGGEFTTFNGNTRNRIVCLNSDGTENTQFYFDIGKSVSTLISSTGFNDYVTSIDYIDDVLYVGGNFTTLNGVSRIKYTALQTNGLLNSDIVQNIGTGLTNSVGSISYKTIKYDSVLIILGNVFTTYNGVTANRIVAINPNGTINYDYHKLLGSAGGGFNNDVYSVAIQDQKMVIVGAFTTFEGITKNRILFMENMGGAQIDWESADIFSHTLDVRGQALDISAIEFSEDSTFYTNLGTAFNNQVKTIEKDTISDSLYVGGEFTTINGVTNNRLGKLNADGSPDLIFNPVLGTGIAGGGAIVNKIAVQTDGKILVGGDFTTLNGVTRNRLVRINSNGSVDTAFYTNLGTAFGSTVNRLAIQPDGKILVCGIFTTFNALTRNRLIRLNADGTEDTAFYTNMGTAFGGDVHSVIYDTNTNKILVIGAFTTFNGNTRNRIVRLNSNGTEDSAFYTNLGTAFGINPLDITLSGSRYVVGGSFTTFNGNTRNRIVCLNSDGTEYTNFYTNCGVGFNSDVSRVYSTSDGKITAHGLFTQLNNKVCRYLVRLNSDGTEDYKFNASLYKDSIIFTNKELNNSTLGGLNLNGSYIIYGNFTTVDGKTRNRIYKINETVDSNASDKSIYVTLRAGDNDVEYFEQSAIIKG